MKDQIINWINSNGSFSLGVRLLESLSSKQAKAFYPLLDKPFLPPGAKKKLTNALKKHLDHIPIVSSTLTPSIERIEEPESITRLKDKGRSLLKTRSELKAQLNMMVQEHSDKYTDEDRLSIAQRIMLKNVPAVDKVYNAIHTWEDSGELPPAASNDLVSDTVSKVKELLRLRPQLTRLKRKNAPKEDIEAISNKIAALEKELDW